MAAQPRALITSWFSEPGDAMDRFLQDHGVETVLNRWHEGRNEEELISLLRGIDAAIVSVDPFTRRVLASAKSLKVVSRVGIGYDSVDVEAATEFGIPVCNTPAANKRAVAEFAMTLLLASARKLLDNVQEVVAGGWTRHIGRDLAEQRLGIIGLGTIGKEVALRARAFEMQILAHDPVRDETFAARHDITYVALEQLLTASDYVMLTVSLTAATRHLINAERLALMAPHAVLINVARGGVVDTAALCAALERKTIAGAALDVFEDEPLDREHPLRRYPNVLMTPHVAGSSLDSFRTVGLTAAENAVAVLRGERPRCIVNPQALGKLGGCGAGGTA